MVPMRARSCTVSGAIPHREPERRGKPLHLAEKPQAEPVFERIISRVVSSFGAFGGANVATVVTKV